MSNKPKTDMTGWLGIQVQGHKIQPYLKVFTCIYSLKLSPRVFLILRQIKCLTCDRQKYSICISVSICLSGIVQGKLICSYSDYGVDRKCLCLNQLASSDHVELLTTTSLLLSPFTGLDGSLPSELHHGYFLWAQIWLRLEHAKYSENYRGTKELGFATFRYLVLFYDSLTPTPLQLAFTGLRPSPHYQ